jgi:phospholipid transport system substrate-binding protein
MLKTILAVCALAAACSVIAVSAAEASPATETFIQQRLDKGYTILNSRSLSEAERRAQFRALLLQLVASRRVALFALGPYAAGASPADLDDFVAAFTNYTVALYEKQLSRYQGQALKVTGSSDRAADDSMVQADVIGPNPSNGQAVNVAFRVRQNESGNPAVTDIVIDGLSLATMARVEIGVLMLQSNGSIPELSHRLNAMR